MDIFTTETDVKMLKNFFTFKVKRDDEMKFKDLRKLKYKSF